MTLDKALVIGNGESRRHLDLNSFRPEYTLIGCNAIHRDITVDHLVCCDRRMIEEAVQNNNTKNSMIYVRDDWFKFYRKVKKNKNIQIVPDLPYIGDEKVDLPVNWGSGCYAILLAATLGFKEIKIIGFDLYSANHKVNNLYKDTDNYSPSTSKAVDYSYWVYQINQIFKHFPNNKFIILNNKDWNPPEEWKKFNVEFLTYK